MVAVSSLLILKMYILLCLAPLALANSGFAASYTGTLMWANNIIGSSCPNDESVVYFREMDLDQCLSNVNSNLVHIAR